MAVPGDGTYFGFQTNYCLNSRKKVHSGLLWYVVECSDRTYPGHPEAHSDLIMVNRILSANDHGIVKESNS